MAAVVVKDSASDRSTRSIKYAAYCVVVLSFDFEKSTTDVPRGATRSGNFELFRRLLSSVILKCVLPVCPSVSIRDCLIGTHN